MTAVVVALTVLFGALHYIPPAHGETPPAAAERPYSCRLFDDARCQCAFGSCDERTLRRHEREYVRDGGRP